MTNHVAPALVARELIERRRNLTYEEFVSRYLTPHQPVIITDALHQWQAVGKWTPQYLAACAGDREFMVDGRLHSFRNLVDLVLQSTTAAPGPYLRNTPVRDLWPGLLDDIAPLPEYLAPNWLDTRFRPRKVRQALGRAIIPDIFLGGAGRGFPFLHYDRLNSHAFLSQIYGSKLYTLYSPEQSACMYPKTDYPNQSRVNDIEDPDLSRFPLFAGARAIQGVLGPGEMVFIPAGWWHTAKILDTSITVSINVVNRSNWSGLIAEQYQTARRSKSVGHRLLAFPMAAYLHGVGVYRSLAG